MATLSVLVTRPSHQSEQLNSGLRQAGFIVISFPTIAIHASTPTPFLKQLDKELQGFDIALFVSRNAVDYAFLYLNARTLPTSLELGVIGSGTWQALKKHGVESQFIPTDSYNSEGLLSSQALHQVKGKRVIIFRGQQGRNMLGDTLQQRGASVEYQEVYRRDLPDYPEDYFDQISEDCSPNLAIFTSAEGLANCFKLLNVKQVQLLRTIPWLLISERMRETARNLRHNADIIIASNASDEGIMQALEEWQQSKV